MTEHTDADLDAVPIDPKLRRAFGVAILEFLNALPDCPARTVGVAQIMNAERATRRLLVREVLNWLNTTGEYK